MLKKVFLLVMGLLCFSLISCSDDFFEEEPGENENLDPNKTTIYIGNYYGGLGDQWLQVLTDQYEETHPDVQFKIENDKTPYSASEDVTTSEISAKEPCVTIS